MPECECRSCREARAWQAIKDTRDPDKLVALIEELQGRLCHAEVDVNYWNAVSDGSWPSAREIAEGIIKRVEERP